MVLRVLSFHLNATVETVNVLIDCVGVDPTIYVQGRGMQAPFGRRRRTRTGETHPYGNNCLYN
jgi:hypothetical protein